MTAKGQRFHRERYTIINFVSGENSIEFRRSTFSADGDELHSFTLDEIQRLGDVGNAVEPHLTSVWFRQLLARDDLQQQHQFQTVTEVFLDDFDLCVHLA